MREQLLIEFSGKGDSITQDMDEAHVRKPD